MKKLLVKALSTLDIFAHNISIKRYKKRQQIKFPVE